VQFLGFGPHLVQAAAVAGGSCAVALLAAYPSIARRDTARAVMVASRVLLVAATVLILDLTLRGTTSVSGSFNLVPGAGVAASFDTSSPDAARNGVENLIGNVVLFVPLGFLGLLALRRRVPVVTVLVGALSVVIEGTQLMLGDRWSDIDDVLLNCTGAFLGALAAARLTAAVATRRKRYVPARS
jgi:glycopeptide antibiotics resistance protein